MQIGEAVASWVPASATDAPVAEPVHRVRRDGLGARTWNMVVGANYPWVRCGHDFGPSVFGSDPVDWSARAAHFRHLRSLGIRVLRFWTLAGGLSYPHRRDVFGDLFTTTTIDGYRHLHVRSGRSLPVLDSTYADHFENLCTALNSADMKLVPSLLSFEWFQPLPDTTSHWPHGRGRTDVVFGNNGRRLDEFLDATLQPLLDRSRSSAACQRAILAWDVFNEPDWPVFGGPTLRGGGYGAEGWTTGIPKTVQPEDMAALLEGACDRIQAAGFTATIGYTHPDPQWLPASLRSRMLGDLTTNRYIHQFHHYPTWAEWLTVPRHDDLTFKPCFVGEFPSARAVGAPDNASWSDLGHWEDNAEEYLYRRLRWFEHQGYPMAMLWCVAPPSDRRSTFLPAQEEQVLRFAHRSGDPSLQPRYEMYERY